MAIQKSGRLNQRSVSLLEKCGIDFPWRQNMLLNRCRDFPLDLMLVRDDDIPEYVRTGVCDIGIVGQNVLEEKLSGHGHGEAPAEVAVLRELGFGHCRLSIAVPKDRDYGGLETLNGTRIATSYPVILGRFLRASDVSVDIVELSGSVEIAPALKVADAICDLVSSGSTLQSNGLEEVETILTSQAVLIRARNGAPSATEEIIDRLSRRIDGVLRAGKSKYIMMNAPASRVDDICEILPGMESPSVVPLVGQRDRVAIHAVAPEDVFWDTMDRLKAAGAASILVVPIEKIIA